MAALASRSESLSVRSNLISALRSVMAPKIAPNPLEAMVFVSPPSSRMEVNFGCGLLNARRVVSVAGAFEPSLHPVPVCVVMFGGVDGIAFVIDFDRVGSRGTHRPCTLRFLVVFTIVEDLRSYRLPK